MAESSNIMAEFSNITAKPSVVFVSDESVLPICYQEGVDSDHDCEYSDHDTIVYDFDDQQEGIFSETSSHTDDDEEPLQQPSRKKRKQTQSKFPPMFNEDNWRYWDKVNIEHWMNSHRLMSQ